MTDRGAIADIPLPQNADAERAVLGAAILNPNSLMEICQQLSAEDFVDPSHQKIFRAEQILTAQQQPIDLVTLTDLLRRQGDLETVGGAAYIASLIDGVPRIQNVAHYAAVVHGAAMRRVLMHACYKILIDAAAGKETVHSLLESGTQMFLKLLSGGGSASLPNSWQDAIISAMEEVTQSYRDPGSVMRLKFGIRDLDEATSGLRRQDFVLIVGQTSHGKTALAMQLGVNADSSGYKGLIFSAEMSKEALAKRELAHAANVPLYYLRRPELVRDPECVLTRLKEAAVQEAKRTLMVVDRDITPVRVNALCELVQRTSGLDFVIVDYDQLVVRAAVRQAEDEYAQQAQFVADALAMAKRLDLCFILLCQPRKVDSDVARGKRDPRVEEIFGHSAVGNTAHHILWIMRRFFQKDRDPAYERDAVVHILKARNDKSTSVEIGFDPDAVLFVDKPSTTTEAVESLSR